MRVVELDSKVISGITIRTNNHTEMVRGDSLIEGLWQAFYDRKLERKALTGVFGVYYDYENQDLGDYSVMAGFQLVGNDLELHKTTLNAGMYRVFRAEGTFPDVIIETWKTIWEYFSNDSCQEQRSYQTDFEWYRSESVVEIYVGIEIKDCLD